MGGDAAAVRVVGCANREPVWRWQRLTVIVMTTTVSRDALGDRMKAYEMAARTKLPARSWTMIRLDGKAFHTWTRGLERPYSPRLVDAMGEVMRGLCEHIPGSVCALQQSDELSVVIQDFAREDTQPWLGGQVQKIVSTSASLMTALFARQFPDRAPAMFDARVFTVPNRVEVANALYWRYIDGKRNAISAIASSMFPARQLHGVSTADRVSMIEAAGVDLSEFDSRFMNGQFATQVERLRTSYVDGRTGEAVQLDRPAVSKVWQVSPAPDLNAQEDGVLLGGVLLLDPAQTE
jgi:tRNA(His) guanylyltransferase